MAVKVAACVDVHEADGLSTLDGGASITRGIGWPSNTPVAVAVFNCRHPSYRLLPAACLTRTTHTGRGKEMLVMQKIYTGSNNKVSLKLSVRQ